MYEKLQQALAAYHEGKTPDDSLFTHPFQVKIGQYYFDIVLQNYGKSDPYYSPDLEIETPVFCALAFRSGYSQIAYGPAYEALFSDEGLAKIREFSVMGFRDPNHPDEHYFIGPEKALEQYHVWLGDASSVNFRKRTTVTHNKPQGRDATHEQEIDPNLRDGIWFQVTSGMNFYVDDAKHFEGGPNDSALITFSNNINRILNTSPHTMDWFQRHPPPARNMKPGGEADYLQTWRNYIRKLSMEAIENDHWVLLWRGYMYYDGRSFDFAEVVKRMWKSIHELDQKWKPDTLVAKVDAKNNDVLGYTEWLIMKQDTALSRQKIYGKAPRSAVDQKVLGTFAMIANELRAHFPDLILRESICSIKLMSKISGFLNEGLLTENMTYNQLVQATVDYWTTRLKTVKTVKDTPPPELVTMRDGTAHLAFDFRSQPSTEGKRHNGAIQFFPDKSKTQALDKLKDWWLSVRQKFNKFRGAKVPPKVLKGSDLRNMVCQVTCDCKDFKYRMSWANVKQNATSQKGRTDNGDAPVHTNPGQRPGICKHLLACLSFLADDANLELHPEWAKDGEQPAHQHGDEEPTGQGIPQDEILKAGEEEHPLAKAAEEIQKAKAQDEEDQGKEAKRQQNQEPEPEEEERLRKPTPKKPAEPTNIGKTKADKQRKKKKPTKGAFGKSAANRARKRT